MTFRYYDPEYGRFTQIDPIGFTSNFVYAANNPVMMSDPSGLVPCAAEVDLPGDLECDKDGAYYWTYCTCWQDDVWNPQGRQKAYVEKWGSSIPTASGEGLEPAIGIALGAIKVAQGGAILGAAGVTIASAGAGGFAGAGPPGAIAAGGMASVALLPVIQKGSGQLADGLNQISKSLGGWHCRDVPGSAFVPFPTNYLASPCY